MRRAVLSVAEMTSWGPEALMPEPAKALDPHTLQ